MFGRANCLVAMVGLWACASVATGAGVVAWYEFEDNLLDSSGNGRDGTIALDPPDYVAGVDGQAIRFDTTNEGVKAGPAHINPLVRQGLPEGTRCSSRRSGSFP